jgi:hypothetical protein
VGVPLACIVFMYAWRLPYFYFEKIEFDENA